MNFTRVIDFLTAEIDMAFNAWLGTGLIVTFGAKIGPDAAVGTCIFSMEDANLCQIVAKNLAKPLRKQLNDFDINGFRRTKWRTRSEVVNQTTLEYLDDSRKFFGAFKAD